MKWSKILRAVSWISVVVFLVSGVALMILSGILFGHFSDQYFLLERVTLVFLCISFVLIVGGSVGSQLVEWIGNIRRLRSKDVSMSTDINTSGKQFIFGWVRNNFFAWAVFELLIYTPLYLLGLDLSGFLGRGPTQASVFVSALTGAGVGNPNFPMNFISAVILGVLFGASIGGLQWLWLSAKGWRIPALWWIAISLLCWGVSTLISSLPSIPGAGLDFISSDFPTIGLLILGVVLGALQAVVMRKSLRSSIWWVAANALGMFVLGLAIYCIGYFPWEYKPFFRNILYWVYDLVSHSGFYVYLPPKLVYGVFFWPVVLPILAAMTTSLPTGFLLLHEFRSRNAGNPFGASELQSEDGRQFGEMSSRFDPGA